MTSISLAPMSKSTLSSSVLAEAVRSLPWKNSLIPSDRTEQGRQPRAALADISEKLDRMQPLTVCSGRGWSHLLHCLGAEALLPNVGSISFAAFIPSWPLF